MVYSRNWMSPQAYKEGQLGKKSESERALEYREWICDREKMAENLGADYIFSAKPHPGLLAAVEFGPEAVHRDAADVLDKAKGCPLEIIMKDNHTIRNDPRRATEWVRIVREEIDRRA